MSSEFQFHDSSPLPYITSSFHGSSDSVSLSNDNTTSSSFSSTEKEQLFNRRYSEGYDLQDEEYFSWLLIHHPEALPNNRSSVVDFFPDAQPLRGESVHDIQWNLR